MLPVGFVASPVDQDWLSAVKDKRSPKVPVVARVECRSETRGEDTPLALWVGGVRLEITDVVDRAILGGAEAGEPLRQRLWVEVATGERFELMRTLPEGRWLVFR